MELNEGVRQFGDGVEEDVGFGGAKTSFCGEGTEDGDGGAYAGAAGHLQVFGGVAHVDGICGAEAHVAKRKETQPIGEWSCGSTFTNPPGDHAARLIEAAGLKGTRIGDIMVSPKHANFLVNVEAASAADVERLVALIQQEVARQFGVQLTPEFRTVGESH